MLREHGYLGHAQLRALGGVGEMFDTLLVYENFPMGGLAAGGELTSGEVTFRPAALESLSHFPITLAAHMADRELVVLVEVIDGALGDTTAATLGRRLLATAERLLRLWDRPLREVGVLLDDEAAPLRATDASTPPTQLGVHARFAEIAKATPDEPAVSWSGGTMSYRELDASANRLAATLTAGGGGRNPGRHTAFPRAALHRRDARRAQGRRHVRAAGAGDARGTREFYSAPKRRGDRDRRRAARGPRRRAR